MGSDNIDNEKLLSEIDSLEDENEAVSKESKNVKGTWLKILGLIVLIGLCTLYFGESYYYEDTEEEYLEEEIQNYILQESELKNKFESQKSNIVIKDSFFNFNKELVATVFNNNTEAITDLKIEIAFFDSENKLIGIDATDIGIVEKNSKYYVKFFDTPENFERYEFLISKDYYLYDNEESVTEQVSYEIAENKQSNNLVVKNNSSKEISEVNFQIVYYDKDDNVIDVEDVYMYDLKKKRTQVEELNLDIYDNKTYELVEYARYEINLLGAYIY